MVEIYSMSAGFLKTYMAYSNKDKIDFKEVFKQLSLEMGGDGTKITKDELDDYIDKAESGLIDIDKKKLAALKRIQINWDTISGGSDEITFGDMEKYIMLLAATLTGGFETIEIEKPEPSINDAIYDYLTDYLNLSDRKEVTKSDLASYLNELIADASNNDDSNNELIGALTNLIASYSSNPTVETEV